MTTMAESGATSPEEFKAEMAKRRAESDRKAKRNVLIVGAVLLAAWAYTGFMGPAALTSGITASTDCVKFAKEKNVVSGEVYATNLRIRHSAWAVDVIGKSSGYGNKRGDIERRTCVVDGEFIRIVSMFEQMAWQ